MSGKQAFYRPDYCWLGRAVVTSEAEGWYEFASRTVPSGRRWVITGVILTADAARDFKLTINDETKRYFGLVAGEPVVVPFSQPIVAKSGDTVKIWLYLSAAETVALVYSVEGREESI